MSAISIDFWVIENIGWTLLAVASLYLFLNYGGALGERAQGAKVGNLTAYALNAIRIDIKVFFSRLSKALGSTLLFIFAFRWLGNAVGGLTVWYPEVWASFVAFLVSLTNGIGLTDFSPAQVGLLVVGVAIVAFFLRLERTQS